MMGNQQFSPSIIETWNRNIIISVSHKAENIYEPNSQVSSLIWRVEVDKIINPTKKSIWY